MSIKKKSNCVLKNTKIALSLHLEIQAMIAFFGTSQESSIWEDGRPAKLEKDKSTEKVYK